MDSLIYSLNATLPIFAVIFLSYGFKCLGLLPDAFVAGADRFTFRVLLPLLLFRDIAGSQVGAQFDLRFFLLCAGVTTAAFLGCWAVAECFLKDKTMVGAFTQGAFRGSLAILGVAFAQNLYGDAGLVPLMIVASVPLFNIYSVIVLTVRAPDRGQAAGFGAVRSCAMGVLTNPIILGILAGLPFSLFGVTFPVPVARTLDSFASMATPLALVTIGAGFEGRRALQKLGPTFAASVLKLLVLPALFLPVGIAMGFRDQALVALLILLGAPSTVTCYIMCKNMGGDAPLSASIIVLTTALSALTLTGFLTLLRAGGLI